MSHSLQKVSTLTTSWTWTSSLQNYKTLQSLATQFMVLCYGGPRRRMHPANICWINKWCFSETGHLFINRGGGMCADRWWGRCLSSSAVGGEQQWIVQEAQTHHLCTGEAHLAQINLPTQPPHGLLPLPLLQESQKKRGQEIINKALKREARRAFDPETPCRLIHNTCSQTDISSRRSM